jgi:hypothetical protein
MAENNFNIMGYDKNEFNINNDNNNIYDNVLQNHFSEVTEFEYNTLMQETTESNHGNTDILQSDGNMYHCKDVIFGDYIVAKWKGVYR